ncbi:MAG: polysaccharide deacetylase family protein [Alphaproteobacteria bacterium]
MTDWTDLTLELDAWGATGVPATIWWRDDDAVEPTPAFERLLELAAGHAVPLALAVIPARASQALAARITAAGNTVTPIQHGFTHRNHAPSCEKKIELGNHRPRHVVCEELARGQARMASLFGPHAQAILVPPWNRIDRELVPDLPALGFGALSTYGPRPTVSGAPGLTQVNCHLDFMRWAMPRGFAGDTVALALLLGHLRRRRQGSVDASEPSGILSHHAAHDAAAWDFLDRLLATLRAHPAVRFVTIADAMRAAASTATETPALLTAALRIARGAA